MIPTIIRDKATKLYLLLGGFFITNAIIAEVIGVKIFSLEKAIGITPFGWVIFGHSFSFNLTAGVLLWPVVFVMTDIINGYYGIKGGSVFIFHGCCPYCSYVCDVSMGHWSGSGRFLRGQLYLQVRSGGSDDAGDLRRAFSD